MAMGRQGDRQGELMAIWSEMPRSPGHVFYDRLQEVLLGAGFDGFVEEACQPYHDRLKGRVVGAVFAGFVEESCQAYCARTMGAASVPPGPYFRMHMVGYFE